MKYIKYFIFSVVFIGFSVVKAGSYEDFLNAFVFDKAEVVQALLERGFEANGVDEQGNPALVKAVITPAPRIFQVLLNWPKTDVNAVNPQGESALMLAAIQGRLDWVKALIARDADVNMPGWTPLHYAASKGHIEVMRELIENHAYIDAESPNGTTPLMMAAYYGGSRATKLLLEEGADPRLKNQKNLSALDFAYSGPHKEAYEYVQAFTREIKP
ncbi:MAG: ankyrin repeat domain-containing protein [Betaproteobacteria bacterium]|nr:ankyrin repeat domain-containing protein [Betaproteobacteria bacterium]